MRRHLISVVAVVLGLLCLASSNAPAAAAAPTLTVTRDCESYRNVGADSIDIHLTGFPPATPFEVTVEVSNGLGIGPWEDTTDSDGSAEPGVGTGEFTHETWTVTVVWSGGTLTRRLYVDCSSPDGAVTVIPPDDYSNSCDPNGAALQGHEGDDVIDGTPHFDLLRGGGGDDSLAGDGLQDCLFGQRGADEIRGQEQSDFILGQRGPDLLKGGQGRDWIRGGRGADTISGGKANDHVFDTYGRDRISCGKGIDEVKTIAKSKVAANCEHVHIRREF